MRALTTPPFEDQLVRAEALLAMSAEGPGTGRAGDRDALRWYASLEDGYFHWGAPFVGPALVAAARIHERNGRAEDAAAAYERFLTLWADADPELDAWLGLARERLDEVRELLNRSSPNADHYAIALNDMDLRTLDATRLLIEVYGETANRVPLDRLRRDVRQALRQIRRSPASWRRSTP